MELFLILVFSFSVGAALIFIGLKIIFPFAVPALNYRKKLKPLRHLIAGGVYDPQTVQTAVKLSSFTEYQENEPVTGILEKKSTAKRRKLNLLMDLFLTRNVSCRYLLILGNSGTGKSSFALNYYAACRQRMKKNSNYNLVLLRMNMPDLDQTISSLPEQNSTALFLDGLEEDVMAFSDPHKRLRQLMENTRRYRRVIITCQSGFIPKIDYLPVQHGYEVIEPERPDEKRLYRLRKCFIAPLTKSQIISVLDIHLTIWQNDIKKKIMGFIKLHGAVVPPTPLMIQYLTRVVSDKKGLSTVGGIFDAFVQTQVEKEEVWKDKTRILIFLNRLARDSFQNWIKQGEDSCPVQKAEEQMKILELPPDSLKTKKQDIIFIDSGTAIRFRHRVLMEYLYVKQLAACDKRCYGMPLTRDMKVFLFDLLNARLSNALAQELEWLSGFGVRVKGLNRKNTESGQSKQSNIFQDILEKNSQFQFVNRLNSLFENPIFYEFGWDKELFENLNKAVLKSKATLMKLKRKKWVVLVSPQKIEITKRDRKTMQILINQRDFKEYVSVNEEPGLKSLNRSVGLNGLRMIHSINNSKKVALLPDLKTFRSFTLFFEEKTLKE